MTPLDVALAHAAACRPVFPCQWQGARRKQPLIERGVHAASTEPTAIRDWLSRWPEALIGMVTGEPSNIAVLDVDTKHNTANGYDTLDDLGFGVLPDTPIAHTASGGLHLYFRRPLAGLRNTGGARGRGIGPGLDWRGDGGYVIVPSPGSGYSWAPHHRLSTEPLAEVPPGLLPRELERPVAPEPVRPTTGLSPYAAAALDNACRRIVAAPAGEQEATLNGESFAIGTLAGAGAIPTNFARRVLTWAAVQLPSHDRKRPWLQIELERKVERAFNEGVRHPRVQHA